MEHYQPGVPLSTIVDQTFLDLGILVVQNYEVLSAAAMFFSKRDILFIFAVN